MWNEWERSSYTYIPRLLAGSCAGVRLLWWSRGLACLDSRYRSLYLAVCLSLPLSLDLSISISISISLFLSLFLSLSLSLSLSICGQVPWSVRRFGIYASCHTHEWSMRHVTRYLCVMSRPSMRYTWMSHVTHMNEIDIKLSSSGRKIAAKWFWMLFVFASFSVLQSVAVCCSLLQSVAVCCSAVGGE